MKQLWMGLQMADKEIITNIKDLKEYLKYLLNNEIRHREKERGIGVFLAENIQRYDFQCAEILLLQRLLKKLGLKLKTMTLSRQMKMIINIIIVVQQDL